MLTQTFNAAGLLFKTIFLRKFWQIDILQLIQKRMAYREKENLHILIIPMKHRNTHGSVASKFNWYLEKTPGNIRNTKTRRFKLLRKMFQ